MSSKGSPASGGGKKSLKQGNLFSFFSKKPKSAATSTSSETSPASIAKHAAPKKKAAAESDSNNRLDEIKVGIRLSVYWPDDGKYYDGAVTSLKKNLSNGKCPVTFQYDDGEIEKIDLAKEQFKILSNQEPPKKKRRTIQEDDDDEAEMEFDDDVSEGSAYQDTGAANDDDDDDDDEAQWMVSDDDDDKEVAQPVRKKLKFDRKSQDKQAPKVTKYQSAKKPAKAFITPPPSSIKKSTKSAPIILSASAPVNVTPSSQGEPLMYVEKSVNPAGAHVHNHLRFLRNPKDANGHPVGHPNYSSHTLKIDNGELNKHQKVTNAVRQWWDLKAQYFDTVLLFKTGKFYESSTVLGNSITNPGPER